MDTSLEALFKAMIGNGWFINSNGDVEAPCGYFGYTNQTHAELEEIYEAFSDTVEAYGKPSDDDIVGSFFAYIDSNGIISIEKFDSVDQAHDRYNAFELEYATWNDQEEA